MILYLDASALVKRYVAEPGTVEVNEAIAAAEIAGTTIVSRAEVVAALAKSVRMRLLSLADASASLRAFRNEWLDLVRVQTTEIVVTRADTLAWEYHLRGYDAVQLATASLWQEAMAAPVTLATFDQQLWTAAKQIGLTPYPYNLAMWLETWKKAK